MQQTIYLDHAATTPMHPKVVEAMIPYMTTIFGNPSSIHSFGRAARRAVDEARSYIATSISALENEIIFTSGGTEADNMAIIGTAHANRGKGNHIITTSIEHHAVLHACKHLEKEGFEITYLPVNDRGEISIEQLQAAIKDTTILVSIMYGNNEVGTIQPIRKIGQLLADTPIVFHTDAVQAFGLEKINVKDLHIDLLSASAHKINGPKGIGMLYAKKGINITPIIYGGEQERKRRAGTENVAGIVGFKEALLIAQEQMESKRKTYEQMKQQMCSIFQREGIDFAVNGKGAAATLPHVLNVSFPGTNVESFLIHLDLAGIAVSSGSACTAGSLEPSHVLVAMFGKSSDRTTNSVRFSFGYDNTLEQIEETAIKVANIVRKLTTNIRG